jgi:hypothetical protein
MAAFYTAVKIDEGVRRPQPVAEFFARNDLSGVLQKHAQNLERLFLHLQPDPTLAQLACSNIYLVDSEPKNMEGLRWRGHRLVEPESTPFKNSRHFLR